MWACEGQAQSDPKALIPACRADLSLHVFPAALAPRSKASPLLKTLELVPAPNPTAKFMGWLALQIVSFLLVEHDMQLSTSVSAA